MNNENNKNFLDLLSKNVNDKIEVKEINGVKLKYLSWSWAYTEFKKTYPNFTYEIKTFGDNKLPYQETELGIMVWTSITVDGETRDMWLPVMDGANRSLKKDAYSIKKYNKYEKKWEEVIINGATMNDINKTIMRCLVKNMAMFGLGLYIYAGEDLPEQVEVEEIKKEEEITNFNELKQAIINSQDMEEIKKIYINSKIKLTNEEKEEIQKLVNEKKEFLK